MNIKHALCLALLAPAAFVGCGGSGTSCDPDKPGTICTIAGVGASGYGGDEGPATKALLYTPQETAWGPDGQLWLLDYNNYVVRSIDDKGVIHTRVGANMLGDSPDTADGQTSCPALQAKFNHTPNMFFDSAGTYLYLSAWHASWVKRVELSSMLVTDFAGEGKRTIYTGEGGPALMAAVDLPSSVAIGPDGNVYLMDQANQVIRKVDVATGVISRFAGVCTTAYFDLGQPPCSQGTTLQQCPNSDKTTYCDGTDGTTMDMACGWPCQPAFSGDGGPALSMHMAQTFGQFADPTGRLVFDKSGNLFFADTENNRIRKIDTNGMVSTVAGTGAYVVNPDGSLAPSADGGYAGDGGPATMATLNHPVDLAFGDDGTLYFTDTNNNCVRQVNAQGVISTVAGDCTSAAKCGAVNAAACNSDVGAECATDTNVCFAGDGGPPQKALLNHPYAVSVHGKKLYISDTYNNRIRVVNLP